MKARKSIDENFLLRFLFIQCFIHIYRVLTRQKTTETFSPPRFPLFQTIKKKFESCSHSLFKNILWTWKWQIIMGGIICIIFACFNLVVPELIKMFMHFMHGPHSEKTEVSMASNFIRTLVAVQVIRLIFGEHSKRIFHELAIKIESSLSKMLVEKSINLTEQARKDIPHSEIIQLENVDLKLTFLMFNNMHLIFQAPFTIIVAIIMLFVQSRMYGFIGVYWFLIAFLLHRELDERMTECNSTKLGLIEKRSKINYEVLDCIKEAKIIGWEDVLIEKNNDLFEEENHDHHVFYFYSSLYDIILLMLPILVVVTICVYDLGEASPITVEQVYLMLSLLGICYEPMKSFRTISISFHDGLHSLNRIDQYLNMPEKERNTLINQNIEKGRVYVRQGTSCVYPGSIFDFYLNIKIPIQVEVGEKLIILAKKGHGKSSFMHMVNGFMKKLSGEVKIRGPIAYMSQNYFFTKSKIRQNISFFNDKVSQNQIQTLFEQFGLSEELKHIGGLNAVMDDINLFTKSQLQKISLLRVLCSRASLYLIELPFQFLDKYSGDLLNSILKKKQFQDKVTIIMTIDYLDYVENENKILVLERGEAKEFGYYSELIKNPKSRVLNFFSSKEEQEQIKSTGKRSAKQKKKSPALGKFQKAVKKISAISTALKGFSAVMGEQKKLESSKMLKSVFENILQAKIEQKKQLQMRRDNVPLRKLIQQFVFSVSFSETVFILLIIACAELLHVFIHYWIGHLQEEHGQNSYMNFQSMIVIEVILTIGLALVLYYEGEVSSRIAIIQGNNIYKDSLTQLTQKPISWFSNEYSVKIADKFNHVLFFLSKDYEQIFIACHSLLNIYKNVIILFVTVRFISSDGFTVFIIFFVISFLYFSILWLFRSVQRKVVKHFYDFKYQYVRNLQESIQGAEYFHVFEKQDFLIQKTEAAYRRLAGYKLAQRNTSYGLALACDTMSTLLLAGAVFYGLQMKMHGAASNIALIATSIHLLMNGSQVLRNIVKDTVTFESFFLINLAPFLHIKYEGKQKQNEEQLKNQNNQKRNPYMFNIRINQMVFREKENRQFLHPISLSINEGQTVLIYNSSDTFRNMILESFTNNKQKLYNGENQHESIQIGGIDITDIEVSYLRHMIGVVMVKNFYMSGTLKDNILRKIQATDEEVDKYIKMLKLDEDIEDYDLYGLDSPIRFENNRVNNEITKKFAIIRILLRKCPIIFIKDIPSFIGSKSMVEIFQNEIENCTIIKLSNKVEAAFDVQRIIHIENHIVLEDGDPNILMKKQRSSFGTLLRDANLQGYIFMNKVSKVNRAKGFLKKIMIDKSK